MAAASAIVMVMSYYAYKYSLKREKRISVHEDANICLPRLAAEFVEENLDIADKEQEHLCVLFLDTKGKIKGWSTVTIGLLDRSHAHAREVFRNAILQGASRVILTHNHPSGDTHPSGGDVKCTEELAEAGGVIGIDVVDHVIVSEGSPHHSLRESHPHIFRK